MLSLVHLGTYGSTRETTLAHYEIAKKAGIECEVIFSNKIFGSERVSKVYPEIKMFKIPDQYPDIINHLRDKDILFTIYSPKLMPLYLFGKFRKNIYVHAGFDASEQPRPIKEKFVQSFRDLYWDMSDKLFLTSWVSKWTAVKRYPKKKVVVLPHPPYSVIKNGLFPSKKPEIKIPDEYYLFFGAVHRFYKGIDVLLSAAKKTGDIPIVVAGKSNYDIKQTNIIHINKWMNDDELNWLIQNAHAVLLPYLGSATSGAAALSFKFKVPVIASRVPGVDIFVDDKKTGFFFKAGDDNELAQIMIELWDKDLSFTKENIDKRNKEIESWVSKVLITNFQK